MSEETPRPQIGDTRPAPQVGDTRPAPQIGDTRPAPTSGGAPSSNANRNRRRKKRGSGASQGGTPLSASSRASDAPVEASAPEAGDGGAKRNRRRSRGGDRRAKAQGRYAMYVHGSHGATHIATMEGRSLVEFRVARAADETNQIDGNIYVGRVQNVLPGMELAFVDIGIPKNAVLYRSDVAFDSDDVDSAPKNDKRIEEMLKAGQTIVCQVTKNAIGAKGARLTQDVSLPGRFAVLVPNSQTIGISKRLGDGERKRLRKVIDDVRPAQHGIIVRTAAEGVASDDLARDVRSLAEKWAAIEAEVAKSPQPRLIYRDLDLAVRMLREELNDDYRSVLIDDKALFDKVREYVLAVNPELADRVEYYDAAAEGLPLFERYFVQEQLQRALDRKVWLPSGGSLIIERTEALTVIDVNTGKLKWYYQHLPADDSDLDHTNERELVRVKFNPDPKFVKWINPAIKRGEERDVTVNIAEGGGLSVLDRVTGEFLWATPFPFDTKEFAIADIDPKTGRATINYNNVITGPGQTKTICYWNTKSYWPASYSPRPSFSQNSRYSTLWRYAGSANIEWCWPRISSRR